MKKKIAVIGGGISGLASARRLSTLGHDVTIIEASQDLGGLGSTFGFRGHPIERFYHCMLPTDDALLRFVGELGLEGDLVWRETAMGFLYQKRLYSLNSPMDLLRFDTLRLDERIRLGLVAIWARFRGEDPKLDDITAESWLRSMVGDRAFDVLWKPLLSAKIGDGYSSIPALWVSSRLHREKNTKKESKGFLTGGYRSLIDAFHRALVADGVDIRLNQPVKTIAIEGDAASVTVDGGEAERFDAVICTLPPPKLEEMAPGVDLGARIRELSLDYQGAICGVILTDKPLSRYYWMPFVDCGATSQGVIEMSNLVPPSERTGGTHVNYFVNYAHRSSEIFQRSDDDLLKAYRNDVASLFADTGAKIVDTFMFRAPFVEPIWTLGYQRRKPPTTVIPGRLYTASTAHLYPRVNSWNSCCEVVEEMIAEMGPHLEQR
jgi:protoporphyrinogen oxidase